MRLVFKAWDSDAEHALVNATDLKIALPVEFKAPQPLMLRMQALHVQRLNENSAVLIVQGEAMEKGLPSLIAAYWFNRRSEAWSLISRQDVVEWMGATGQINKSSVIELFPGNYALTVEYGLAGASETASLLRLFRIGPDLLTPMMDKTADIELQRHAENSPECAQLMRPPKGKHSRPRLHLRESDAPPNCYDYVASWNLITGNDAPGMLVVDFSSKAYQYLETGYSTDTGDGRINIYDLRATLRKGRKTWTYDSDSKKYVFRDEQPSIRKK